MTSLIEKPRSASATSPLGIGRVKNNTLTKSFIITMGIHEANPTYGEKLPHKSIISEIHMEDTINTVSHIIQIGENLCETIEDIVEETSGCWDFLKMFRKEGKVNNFHKQRENFPLRV